MISLVAWWAVKHNKLSSEYKELSLIIPIIDLIIIGSFITWL
jgi:hypothetical protein